jgi:hypothetical protein
LTITVGHYPSGASKLHFLKSGRRSLGSQN